MAFSPRVLHAAFFSLCARLRCVLPACARARNFSCITLAARDLWASREPYFVSTLSSAAVLSEALERIGAAAALLRLHDNAASATGRNDTKSSHTGHFMRRRCRAGSDRVASQPR